MRKTIAVVEAGDSASGADGKAGGNGNAGVGVAGITETMGGIIGAFEEGCGVGGVVSGDAALHDARIIIDMDRVRNADIHWPPSAGSKRCGARRFTPCESEMVSPLAPVLLFSPP